MTCFVIFFLPILLYLGYWQISRGFEKKEIWEAYSVNKTLPPINEKELFDYQKEDLFYRSVVIQGSYINDTFLLDNRMHQSKKGYEVFTPFKSEGQQVYLINRGWTGNYSDHPFSAPEGNHFIEGIISPFDKYGLNLSKEEAKNSFPIVVQELIIKNEKRFVNYLNTAQPLTPRIHALELIPGIGKTYLNVLLQEREKKPFESYDDIERRVGLKEPINNLKKRILEEISGETRMNIFVKR